MTVISKTGIFSEKYGDLMLYRSVEETDLKERKEYGRKKLRERQTDRLTDRQRG